MKLLSMAKFGEMHGVSGPAVTKWRRRGLIAFVGNLVDVEASNKNLERYRSAPRPAAKPTEKIPARLVDWLVAGL
jgi:hypothetical protein